MLREIQGYREVSATSYNKSGHTTRSPLPDGKAEKKILV
jgi:hypothetical protein